MTSIRDRLQQRIDSRQAVCAVVGLGYVGLPLAMELCAAGFHMIGMARVNEKNADA